MATLALILIMMLERCASSNCSCAAVPTCEKIEADSVHTFATVSTDDTAQAAAAVAEVARILEQSASPTSSLELLGKFWAARAKAQNVSGIVLRCPAKNGTAAFGNSALASVSWRGP